MGASERQDDVELTVRAQTYVDAMFIRRVIAEAKVEDGRAVEVALNADGAILCTVARPCGKGRFTYAIGPRAFVDAVLSLNTGGGAPCS